MSGNISKAITRRGFAPAFLAAVGVFVFLVVQGFLITFFDAVEVHSLTGDVTGALWSAQLVASVGGLLPFAIGVLLCFWQLTPIDATLRLAHVVTRSVLASLVGAALVWIIGFLIRLTLGAQQSLALADFGGFTSLPQAAFHILLSALTDFVTWVPAVVLAGVLLWGWLVRHPRGHAVAGALDEV